MDMYHRYNPVPVHEVSMLRLQVEWIDSGTISQMGWMQKEEILATTKIGKVVTVGVLFHESEDTLYIALSYDPEHEHWYGVQAINKTSIIKRVVLRER
jgi:hypothetical protein